MGKVVVGQDGTVSELVAALLVHGHVLARRGARRRQDPRWSRRSPGPSTCEFRRVQFTPDLMPSDVVGQVIYEAATGPFKFRRAPCFTNLLLADEINRTPPKTQAALLEAMEERQVSVDGVIHPLPDPFIVVAHPEPGRVRGHLPAARGPARPLPVQARTSATRSAEQEVEVLARHDRGLDPHDVIAAGVQPVATAADLAAARAEIDALHVEPPVLEYVVRLARATRVSPALLARRVAPRQRRPAARGQGVGVAGGPRRSSRPTR